MNFEKAWQYLEEHKAFSVRMHTPTSSLDSQLRALIGKSEGEQLITETSILHSLLKVSYCYIDKKLCTSLWQPKWIHSNIEIDMEKESLSVEAESFELCIIALAEQAKGLMVSDMLNAHA